jgi:hypothetical protein
MSLEQLLEEKNYATLLDNVELMAEDEGSVLYADPIMKQKVRSVKGYCLLLYTICPRDFVKSFLCYLLISPHYLGN